MIDALDQRDVKSEPGPGPSYAETDHGHDYAEKTGRAMAANLVGVARALAATPLGPPPD